MNRPHIGAGTKLGNHAIPALKYHFAESTIEVDHDASNGEWLDLGLLPLPVQSEVIPGWQNTVTLALAYAIDPEAASGNDANERLIIKAWHARPVLGAP
jgi:hypothetical protein